MLIEIQNLKKIYAEGEENEVRTLVRSPLAGAASMLAVLSDIRRSRSARKVPLVKMSVNPPELF